MGSYLLMYLWTRLDIISGLSIMTMGIAFIAYVVSFIIHAENKYTSRWGIHMDAHEALLNTTAKIKKISLVVFCTCLFIILFIPTKRDFAAIYIIPKVANHPSIENWDKVVNKLPKYIQNMLKEE